MASAQIGALRVDLSANTAAFTRGMNQAASTLQRVGARMRQIGTTMAASITAPLAAIGTQAVRAFGVQEDAMAIVARLVESTGNAAGLSAQQLFRMASGLQEVSRFGDEQVLGEVTANLLTFTKVAGTAFARAQQSILDVATVTRRDLLSTTIALGKALNDPVANLGALSRSGIQFSAQQKAVIKALAETNRLGEAQGIILTELERQYGGAAEALARTTTGKLTQAMNAFGDAMEQIGAAIAPMVLAVANGIKSWSEAFQTLSPETQRLIVLIGGLAAALGPALIAVGFLASGLAAVGAPALAIGATIAAVTAAVAAFWPTIQQAARVVESAFGDMFRAAKTWLGEQLMNVLNMVITAFRRVGEGIMFIIRLLGLEGVVDSARAAIGSIGDTANGVFAEVNRMWEAAAATGSEWETTVRRAGASAGNLAVNLQAAGGAAARISPEMRRLIRETKAAERAARKLAERIHRPIAQALTDAVLGTQKLSDALRNAARQIAEMLLNRAFMQLIGSAFGGGGGASGGNVLAGLFGNARGGLYRVAGTGGMERPIALTAQPGELVAVGHAGSGGGGDVTVNIINQASGVAVEQRQGSDDREIELLIRNIAREEMGQPGGQRTMMGAFGIRPRVRAR